MQLLRLFFPLTGHRRTWCGLLLVMSVLMSATTYAQTVAEGNYSRARIWLGPGGLRELQALGIAADHGDSKAGVWFESDFSAAELGRVRAAGYRCDVMIGDVQAHYRQQNTASTTGEMPSARVQSGVLCDARTAYAPPTAFRLGSMGGYCTYDEILQKLDSMQQQWPNLITIKQPTGPLVSVEGNPIYWVKISDNPTVDEPEPEILYNGVHHAREPMSVSQMLYYMYYLLQNYATNPEVRAIVDNTEQYFVPCLNPDGYVYNEATNPQGGGMWRKNRRDNLNGSFGIDLNRNYSTNWGYDNIGSSPDAFQQTYRGPSAFSEPETQAMRDFSLQHSFQIVLNYHAFGNVFIYPFGYAPNVFTPDSAQFADYGRWLTRDDRYTFGTCNQVLGYIANGDANDWQYSTVQGPKPKAFTFTPEVGLASEGFWPPARRIRPLCHENLTRNLDAARLLLADGILTDASPRFFRQRAAHVRYSLKQLGLKMPGTYTVALTPLAGAGVAGLPKTYTLTAPQQERLDSIALTLPASLTSGQTFRYVLSVNNGLFTRRDTLTKVFGTPAVAFASDCSSLNDWDSPLNWDITPTTYHTGPGALTDSPGGDYVPGLANIVTSAQTVDLRGAAHAELSFWARWAIETRFDYAQVLISRDNGITFQPLCGRYSRIGNGYQRLNEPLYDGFQPNWVRETINLDDFAGQQILLRFLLGSDLQNEEDGMYVDDVRIEKVGTTTGLTDDAVTAGPAAWLGAYPSPARDVVTVTATGLAPTGSTLTVHDALGRLLHTQPLTPADAATRLEVRAWPAGLYAATVRAPGRRAATVRFVVGQP